MMLKVAILTMAVAVAGASLVGSGKKTDSLAPFENDDLYFMIFDGCDSDVRTFLEFVSSLDGVDASFHLLAVRPPSMPFVKGVLTLKSDKYDRIYLTNLYSSIENACFPNSYLDVDFSEGVSLEKFEEVVKFNKRVNIEKHMIFIDKNKSRLFFWDNNKKYPSSE
ncbi:hypothetical protein KFE80_00045 [bacterium SCSIO 12696]|nr:hypothetical protein KFE80_00045 [bacterium SCSIO 12696]